MTIHHQLLRQSLLLLCSVGLAAAAPIGTEFGYQGQLRQAGAPVNGTCDFEFSLWSDPNSVQLSEKLGSTQSIVADVVKGFVAVELNGGNQFGPDAFNGDARWLQIAVRCPAGSGGALTPLLPRTKLSPAPYAQYSLDAPISSGNEVWSINGSSIFYNDGHVGIGTSSPGMSLEVSSPSYYGKPAIGASDGDAYAYLHVTNATAHSVVWDSTRSMRFGTETQRGGGYVEHMRITESGNVGIGTNSPTSRLEVETVTGTGIHGLGELGVFGEGADAGVRGYAPATQGGGAVGVHGLAEPSSEIFGIRFLGGIGVKGESPSNIGVLGTSTGSYGVKGESQNNDGVNGISHHPGRSGVWGFNDGGGYGVSGSTTTGYAGVWGSGAVNGVWGSTSSASASGVFGQNDSSGWGVAGYARGAPFGETTVGGTGVEGISDGLGGYGVIGRAHGLNGVALHGEANDPSRTALWAYNPSGRAGLLDGYVEINGYLDVNGATYVNILTIKGGADLAEPFDIANPSTGDELARTQDTADDPMAKQPLPGMVVVIDPDHPGRLAISTNEYDRKVAGIISGANGLSPGMILKSAEHDLVNGKHPVALTGRVWCYCDASNAPIQPGDMLTTSAVPGHAMKATDLARAQGAIIGKAMTPMAEGRGLVLVLVNLQ